MLKKILVASLVLAGTSGLAFANGGTFTPAPQAPCHTGNFYVGAGISRDRGHFESDYTNYLSSNVLVGSPFILSSGDVDLSGEGVGGELFAGYGMTFVNRYYLGLEGFGDITSNDGKMDFNTPAVGAVPAVTGSLKVRQEWSAGVSLMPGVKITDSTLLYARVGWIISEFELNGSAFPIAGLNTTVFDNEKSLNGIEAGLGMEAMVTQNIGLRGEWDWSYYQKFNNTSVDGTFNAPAFAIASSFDVSHPIVDQFKFAVDYHFNMA